jgi:hypothetical protein
MIIFRDKGRGTRDKKENSITWFIVLMNKLS